jgi:hypothetical protein
VLIHIGAKKIPEAHIMKRWTQGAKDFDYPLSAASGSIDNQLISSILHVNALEVVQSAGKDADASQILMKHLSMAKKEMQTLFDERNKNQPSNVDSDYNSTSAPDHGYCNVSGYETEGWVSDNMYGASGSSAYMSDGDILSIKAPTVPEKQSGRPRENRYPRMFEYRRTRCQRNTHFNDGMA